MRASPGHGCSCGFWALWDLGCCVAKARREAREGVEPVIGLMSGWGEIAIHGDEGFRAEHAAILCLFSDSVWDDRFDPILPRPRLLARLLRWHRPVAAGPPPVPALRAVASRYAVPLVPVAQARRSGLLSEFGVTAAIDNLTGT